ncbi:MAG: Holliday junction branch migration protein RuvA, partial [Candidatus Tectomicrobia bacterium]
SSTHTRFSEASRPMIAHVQGVLVAKSVEQVVVDVQGVGYQIFIPLSTYYPLPDLQEQVRLLTTLYVREDVMRLYGFTTQEEQDFFALLTSVSSIGPRLALNMLSSVAAAELKQAIAQESLATLQAIPGVGRKTAERVILELKDKVARIEIAVADQAQTVVSDEDQLVGDVVSALLNLGYKRGEAEKAVRAVRAQHDGEAALEMLLKDSLRVLAR